MVKSILKILLKLSLMISGIYFPVGIVFDMYELYHLIKRGGKPKYPKLVHRVRLALQFI